MMPKNIRIISVKGAVETKLKAQSANDVLDEWIKLSIEDLEHRIRYSKEETQVLQGALRALDDLQEVLKKT